MRSFACLTAFTIATTSLTAAVSAPVAELNTRQFGSFGFPFITLFGGGDGGAGGLGPAKGIEAMIGQEIKMLEGVSPAIASETEAASNQIFSAAVTSESSAAAISIANEASSTLPAAPALPTVAVRQPLLLHDNFTVLEGATLESKDPAASPATPSINVRRQNSNPFADIAGLVEGQAQIQASAIRAAVSGFSAFVASQTATERASAASAAQAPSISSGTEELGAASSTPAPSVASEAVELSTTSTTPAPSVTSETTELGASSATLTPTVASETAEPSTASAALSPSVTVKKERLDSSAAPGKTKIHNYRIITSIIIPLIIM
jgi:hypothetical protein